MKFSNCLALAALTLSVSAHAQTSQTFNFGEGEATPHQANAHAQPSHAPRRKTSHHKPVRQPASTDLYSHG